MKFKLLFYVTVFFITSSFEMTNAASSEPEFLSLLTLPSPRSISQTIEDPSRQLPSIRFGVEEPIQNSREALARFKAALSKVASSTDRANYSRYKVEWPTEGEDTDLPFIDLFLLLPGLEVLEIKGNVGLKDLKNLLRPFHDGVITHMDKRHAPSFLTELCLTEVSLGDDLMRTVATGVKYNKTLRTFSLMECDLNMEGPRAKGAVWFSLVEQAEKSPLQWVQFIRCKGPASQDVHDVLKAISKQGAKEDLRIVYTDKNSNETVTTNRESIFFAVKDRYGYHPKLPEFWV